MILNIGRNTVFKIIIIIIIIYGLFLHAVSAWSKVSTE